ncbi:heparan-alpha-glucosaminide N-acetyltransferase domain-containing protein [Actinosynnema pretiosum subsp. pretiosum]
MAGVDLARGAAVLGVFAAHVGPDGGVAGWVAQLAHGRASALFATLAGVSLALVSGGREPARDDQAATRIALRAVILLLFGTALTASGTAASVVLAYYGVYFLLALPFLRLRAPALAVAAVVVALVGPVLSLAVRGSLDTTGRDQLVTSGDPVEVLGGEGVLRLVLTGACPAATWMPFVLAGMALGRLDLTTPAIRTRLAFAGPALVVAGYGGSWLALGAVGGAEALAGDGPVDGDAAVWLLVAFPHSGTTFEITGALGVAVTTLVAALVVAERWPRWARPVTTAGTMPLTLCVLHVAAIDVTGLAARPGPPLLVLPAFAAGACGFALLWCRFSRRGPLEHLLHAATTRPKP